MNKKPTRNRVLPWTAASLLTLTILAVLLLVTPQGKAWAQEILRFFTRSTSDNLPVQSWQLTPQPTSEAPTSDPASILDANQTVSEVEQQAGFHVLEPAWLPDSLTFAGASLETDHNIARLFYRLVETNGLVLRQQPVKLTDTCELCGEVGSSAAVEEVSIGNETGEYVEGVWSLTDQGPVWEDDPYMKTLRWQANGMAFELMFMGPPDAVSKNDMIAVAASLK
ncbi:MAG: hypothetical protein ABSA51_05180 [Anaerolineaceae bacterium]